jgi:hypothetical protein
MIDTALRNEAILLVMGVAPELFEGQCPLYLLSAADLGRPIPETCSAYCQRTAADVVLRDYLIAANQWAGHGVGIVFDLTKIEATTTDLRQTFLAVLIHEVGHAVLIRPVAPRLDIEPPAEVRRLQESIYRTFATAPKKHGIDEAHDDKFVRVLSHLWWRAAGRGVVANFGEMLSPWVYGIDLHAYVEALGPELWSMRDETFAAILATEPPAAFTQLWQRDCERLENDRSN